MENVSLLPLSKEEEALLFGDSEPKNVKRRYKIHNDGSHYVGTMCLPRCLWYQRNPRLARSKKVVFFESLFLAANKLELKGVKFSDYIREKLLEAYPEMKNVDGFIEEHTKRGPRFYRMK